MWDFTAAGSAVAGYDLAFASSAKYVEVKNRKRREWFQKLVLVLSFSELVLERSLELQRAEANFVGAQTVWDELMTYLKHSVKKQKKPKSSL